jgi:hypothetical protein
MSKTNTDPTAYKRGATLSVAVLIRAIHKLGLNDKQGVDLLHTFYSQLEAQSRNTWPFLDTALRNTLAKLEITLTPEQEAEVFPNSVKKEEPPVEPVQERVYKLYQCANCGAELAPHPGPMLETDLCSHCIAAAAPAPKPEKKPKKAKAAPLPPAQGPIPQETLADRVKRRIRERQAAEGTK